jgi:hypothetical protein
MRPDSCLTPGRYDKQDSVLRVETTLNRPHQFRV